MMKEVSATAEYLLVLTTVPDQNTAESLASNIIDRSLAACVNILPAMQSIYTWQGKCQSDTENQMLIKTTRARYAELEAFIKDNHPYDLPETIAVPIEAGLTAYLDWLKTSCEE